MRADEITTRTEEGLGDVMDYLLPKAVSSWIRKKAHKGQYQKMMQVYTQIMKDEISPPKDASDALYRAAKAVGLPPREINAMFAAGGPDGNISMR